MERDAQELADSLGVKIFQADIIYHLFDKFMAYREELKQKKREEFRSIAVFPCKLKVGTTIYIHTIKYVPRTAYCYLNWILWNKKRKSPVNDMTSILILNYQILK